jgi:hypothetical protein
VTQKKREKKIKKRKRKRIRKEKRLLTLDQTLRKRQKGVYENNSNPVTL